MEDSQVTKKTLSIAPRYWRWIAVLTLLFVLAGCGKKQQAPAPTPPPPPPAAPTASITANPQTIERGEVSRLTWRTENATDAFIEPLGTVEANGSKDVSPNESTTYRLVARGAGGQREATVRVTVNAAAAPPVKEQAPSQSDEQWLSQNIKDVYFDYDKADIRADQQASLAANARALNQRTSLRILIEGHCDERGSTEYNLTLGDERANAVKNALIAAGVNASRITTISYGKEKPVCMESSESCWQRNRRGHAVLR
ncbi:MAG: peptidoglycan-associated lipoprotein Pal [Acidobacteriales bacterium]|nr:peptidoglycan-associated lipoprotein Pal [Terriglobales bacterium]